MKYKIIEYTEDMGTINWQEGFIEELKGLSIDEQLRCYAWAEYSSLGEVSYKDVEERCKSKSCYLETTTEVAPEAVIVKDGFVVGIGIKQYLPYSVPSEDNFKYIPILPYGKYCYDITSDNNGAGYKETNWYKYLICLPASNELWKQLG